jgi:hypothetical protein
MLLSRCASIAVVAAGAALSVTGVANAQGDRDCEHFSNQAEAQVFFESTHEDQHRLDADNDGIACEHLPAPSHTHSANETPTPSHTHPRPTPVHGIDTGDGSTVDNSTDDNSATLPLLLGLAGLGAVSTTAVVVARRARKTN